MTRTQADQVALAVDNVGWPSQTASKGPLESRATCRAFILAGGIIPPDMDLIYAEDRRLGLFAVILSVVVLWSLIGVVAYMVFA